jgi:hypothetical protein
MANLAATDITLTRGGPYKLGKLTSDFALFTFGDGAKTYPYGGIPLPAIGNFGWHYSGDMMITGPDEDNITWKYDAVNHKLKGYRRAPAVVFEEVVTLTDGVGTTRWPMAWPLYAGVGNVAVTILPAGMTPVTTTMAVDMHSATPGTRATLTTLAGDNYATMTISYITQAWDEVFQNLVEAETMTAGATTTNGITFTAGTPDIVSFLTAGPFLCGLIVGLNLNGTISTPAPIKSGETAAAGEYALDWTNTSPAATTMKILTSLDWNAATAAITFTYLKKPASGFLYSRFIEEDENAASSQVYTLSGGGNIEQPLFIGTPGWMPGPTKASTVGSWPIGPTTMTVGSTTQWQPTNFYPKQKLTTAATFTSGSGVSATNSCGLTWVYGVPEDIDSIVPLEIPDGQVLRNRSVRAFIIGA